MSKITGDEPINVTNFKDGETNCTGLTIRQHFAAMAMQGLLNGVRRYETKDDEKRIAEMATKAADALIEELNK